MAFLTPEQLAAAKSQLVGVALFIKLDFKTQPMYVWSGDGTINRDSIDWEGYFGSPMVSFDPLEPAQDGENRPISITLSGVDTRITNLALEDDANGEIENRRITFYLGFLSTTTTYEPLGPMLTMGKWIMQRPSFDYNSYGERHITMQCQSLFVQRDRQLLAMLTDTDQKRRFPGDECLKFMLLLKDRKVPWPLY
jgi:hypothetical protein